MTQSDTSTNDLPHIAEMVPTCIVGAWAATVALTFNKTISQLALLMRDFILKSELSEFLFNLNQKSS